jgi:rod shape-determining protein MreB
MFGNSGSANVSELREPDDFAIDLGTATGLIFSRGPENTIGSLGSIRVQQTAGGEPTEVNHIPTLVSRKIEQIVEEDETNMGWCARKGKRIHLEMARNEKFKREQSEAELDDVIDNDDQNAGIVAMGQDAFNRWGRMTKEVTVPAVRRGNIADIPAYRALMRHLIRIKNPKFEWSFEGTSRPPRVLIGVPHNATTRHRDIIKHVIEKNLKAEAILIWEQIAAAVGARLPNGGIPFNEPRSVAIGDAGGGTFDFAVLNNGAVANQESFDTAGDDLNEAIKMYLAREHDLDIGDRTAIQIKEAIGSAMPFDSEIEAKEYIVKGSSFATELPNCVTITPEKIRQCLLPVINEMVNNVERYLRHLHRVGDMHGDILENGFYLTGGTSLLHGLVEYLIERTGLKFVRVENPMTSVIDGLTIMLEDDELLELGRATAA